MKKQTLLLVVLLLMSCTSFATELNESPWNGSFALRSQYVATNLELICNKPVIQADVTYKFSDLVSAEIVGFTDFDDDNPSCGKEIDLNLHIGDMSFGYLDIGKIGERDIDIFTVRLNHQFGPISTWIQYIDPRSGDSGFDFRAIYPIDDHWALGLNAGRIPFFRDEYLALSANYNFQWRDLSIDFSGAHALEGAEHQKEILFVSATYFW